MIKIYIFIFNFVLYCYVTNGDVRGHRVRRIVGGKPAQLPPPDDPVVFVKHNGKFARIEGTRNANEYHYHFRGIRYAQSPTGKQRFQRPKAHTLEGEIDATKYPTPCPQPQPGTNKVIGKEDCLFLNVFTPDLPDGTEGLPVIVWIHGGGFRYGSASQYNVQNLVNKRVVLVTIQYRLGSLGFLSTGDRDLPGNAGLFDMAQAVQWTRNYIGFFGGNPYQIVIMGQGTGGSSGLLMCLSKIAKGLTTAAVAMSGTAVSNWAVDNEPHNMAQEVADYHGCPTTNVIIMISCLRRLGTDDVIRGDSSIERSRLTNKGFVSGLSGLLSPSPVSEGRNDGRSLPGFVEMKPLETLNEGDIPNIPLLTGVTRDETGRAVDEQFQNEILKKLGTIPNFLDQVLLTKLQEATGLSKNDNKSKGKNLWSLLGPVDFRNYFSVGKNNIKDAFSKIKEATADALFNLPAFLTANMWSKKNNATFLYRFEHLGQSYKGYHFLQGVPFIGNSSKDQEDGMIGHGDELAYLFKPQNLDGSPLSIEVNETQEDKKVRTIFTDMIYNFVKFGNIKIDNKTVPKFTDSENNYIGISSKPKILNDFRFCQIGLWAGITERLKTDTCKFLSVIGQGVHNIENVLFNTMNATGLNDPFKSLTSNVEKVSGSLTNPGGFLPSGNVNKPRNNPFVIPNFG